MHRDRARPLVVLLAVAAVVVGCGSAASSSPSVAPTATSTRSQTPTPPPDVRGALYQPTGITVGESYTCAITRSGGVKCWGDNRNGQLGDGTTISRRTTPVDVTGLASSVIQISAGQATTCALTRSHGVK